MNERFKELAEQAGLRFTQLMSNPMVPVVDGKETDLEKFAELIVAECVNREALLGAIARGWCSETNSHKTMDSDLAVAIFDEVERQIRQQFEIK